MTFQGRWFFRSRDGMAFFSISWVKNRRPEWPKCRLLFWTLPFTICITIYLNVDVRQFCSFWPRLPLIHVQIVMQMGKLITVKRAILSFHLFICTWDFQFHLYMPFDGLGFSFLALTWEVQILSLEDKKPLTKWLSRSKEKTVMNLFCLSTGNSASSRGND